MSITVSKNQQQKYQYLKIKISNITGIVKID
jgi:hypothetical protein